MPVTPFPKPRWLCVLSLAMASSFPALASAETALDSERSISVHDDSAVEEDLHPRVQRYPSGDGIYGRFVGDLDLSPKLGASYDGTWYAAAGASAWYFWTAGVTFLESQALDDNRGHAKGQSSIAVEIRPLFIPRWSRDFEQGPAWFDLTLDSLSLGVGVYFNRGGEAVERRGLQASLGFGIPLVADARGPWLDLLGVRRIAETHDAANNAVFAALSWHWLLDTGLHDE